MVKRIHVSKAGAIALAVAVLVFAAGVVLVAQETTAAISTKTTVNCKPATITLGAATTVTATLKHAGTGIPSETITFSSATSGTFTSTTGITDSAGSCAVQFTPADTGGGTVSVTATFAGDSSYLGSSGTDSFTVNPATATATGLTVNIISGASGADTITLGGTVTVSVSVNGPSTLTQPTGSVQFQFKKGSGAWTTFDTETLSSGVATSGVYTPPEVGNYKFKAVYLGDSNYVSGTQSGTGEISVTKGTVTVGVSFSPSGPVTVGDPVTVYASVSGPTGATQPTGNVQFKYQKGTGGWINIDGLQSLTSGSAAVIYNPQAVQTYTFEVVYKGDSNYVAGTTSGASSPLAVNEAATSIVTSLTPTGPIAYGNTVADTITITTSATGILPDASGKWKVQSSKDPTFAGGVVTVDSGTVADSYRV